ncbi:MAG TPA: 1-aminocyclopropane-1-carboxylate deaminase/D-cysteine desulfhydrase [Lutibacter sp.]|nr:1-aminocyclopropane-1-carboxylate deaminase/D-cysteine desulfhydrase [Lutibacter sp.]
MILPLENSIIQETTYTPKGYLPLNLWIKRDDLLHPFISGNKYRKLKYNLEAAKEQNHTTLLTFGGAFSNHIAATAAAGHEFGFKTIGIIRGDELGDDLAKTLKENPTLSLASQNGMQFKFVDRKSYRLKHTQAFIEDLKKEFGTFYSVPEGGTNKLAIKGTEEILSDNESNFDYICSAIGTGGTIAGIINSAKEQQEVLGFPALKENFLHNDIQKYLKGNTNWELIRAYNFGGFAKISKELVDFINDFKQQTNIQLDPIYTGKMLFGIVDLHKKDFFGKEKKILAIHTGGLQGIEGMNQRLMNKNLPTIQ